MIKFIIVPTRKNGGQRNRGMNTNPKGMNFNEVVKVILNQYVATELIHGTKKILINR